MESFREGYNPSCLQNVSLQPTQGWGGFHQNCSTKWRPHSCKQGCWMYFQISGIREWNQSWIIMKSSCSMGFINQSFKPPRWSGPCLHPAHPCAARHCAAKTMDSAQPRAQTALGPTANTPDAWQGLHVGGMVSCLGGFALMIDEMYWNWFLYGEVLDFART